jgi:hypothetical protein
VVLIVTWGPRTIALSNVYLPNDPRDNAAAQRHLSSLLGGLPAHTMPILGGDFNFTEDALLDKKSFCPVLQDSHHGPRQHWRQDLGNNLVDVYRYLHLDRREYTHNPSASQRYVTFGPFLCIRRSLVNGQIVQNRHDKELHDHPPAPPPPPDRGPGPPLHSMGCFSGLLVSHPPPSCCWPLVVSCFHSLRQAHLRYALPLLSLD